MAPKRIMGKFGRDGFVLGCGSVTVRRGATSAFCLAASRKPDEAGALTVCGIDLRAMSISHPPVDTSRFDGLHPRRAGRTRETLMALFDIPWEQAST